MLDNRLPATNRKDFRSYNPQPSTRSRRRAAGSRCQTLDVRRMIRPSLIALVILAAASHGSSDNAGFAVKLADNRFEMHAVNTKEFQFTDKQTEFAYTLEIWDDLSRQGVSLYYRQGLESMPLVWKDRGFRLLHREHNSKYMGFCYLLDQEWHMEYVKDFDTIGIRVSTKGSSAESLSRLHDALFIINNVTVVRDRARAEQN